MPQAAETGDIVGFGFQGGGSAPQWVTIGQAFVKGDLRPGQNLALVLGGDKLPVQLDVKATHVDGSVRHAMLTFELPAGTGASQAAMLKVDPIVLVSNTAPVTAQSVLANSGYDLKVTFALEDGTTRTIDAKQALADALAQGTIKTWMSGPQASEFIVKTPINDQLMAELAIRAHADGQVRTDVIVRNEWTFDPEIGTRVYDVAVTQNGATVFERSDVRHYRQANWHKQFWTEEPSDVHVVRDAMYLIESGAVPAHDLSIGVKSSRIEGSYNSYLGSDNDILGPGTINQTMPDTGQTAGPAVGILTGWGTQWLMSQDARAETVLFGNADAAGSVPWHFRKAETGEITTIDEHPRIRIGNQAGTGADTLPERPADDYTGGWKIDTSHQPALNYLPYMLSGDHYYLENLKAQSNYNMLQTSQGNRGYDEGIVAQSQTRGIAWSLRTLADATWIVPDNDIHKKYFSEKMDNNISFFTDLFLTGSASDSKSTFNRSFYSENSEDAYGFWTLNSANYPTATSPWQNDFGAIVTSHMVDRGFDAAADWAQWTANFTTGRFVNGNNGYDPDYGVPYMLNVIDPETGRPFDTWAEVWQATFGPGAPDNVPSYLTGNAGGYGGAAVGALASIISATGSIDAVEAYAFAMSTAISGLDFADDPKWAIMPKVPGGDYISIADILAADNSGSTLAGSGRSDLLIGRAGNDILEGGAGNDLIWGGSGDDVLVGGSGDDYLIGGLGNDRLIAGLGSDQMKGGSGADTFVIDAATSGDRNVIHDFDVLDDTLEIAGSLAASRQALLDGMSVQAGGVVLNIGISATVLLQGLVAEDVQSANIVVQ